MSARSDGPRKSAEAVEDAQDQTRTSQTRGEIAQAGIDAADAQRIAEQAAARCGALSADLDAVLWRTTPMRSLIFTTLIALMLTACASTPPPPTVGHLTASPPLSLVQQTERPNKLELADLERLGFNAEQTKFVVNYVGAWEEFANRADARADGLLGLYGDTMGAIARNQPQAFHGQLNGQERALLVWDQLTRPARPII